MMRDYGIKDGQTRLNQLGIKVSHNWYHDELIYLKDFQNLKFWRTLPSEHLGYVNVPLNQVYGTGHIDYANRKWLENLGGLKRFSDFYTNESCRKYFDSVNKKKGISFSKFGKHYIITEGNHRTHIARFLDYSFIKGEVQEYFFDHELYNLLEEYQIENLSLSTEGPNLYREQLWRIKLDKISFFLHGYNILRQFLDIYKASKPSWIKSREITILKFLETNIGRDFLHIYDQRDFNNRIFKNLPGLKYNKLTKK